jgi:hypothetical protein
LVSAFCKRSIFIEVSKMARPTPDNPMGTFDPVDHPIWSAQPRMNYEEKKMRAEWHRKETKSEKKKFDDGWDNIWGKKDEEVPSGDAPDTSG